MQYRKNTVEVEHKERFSISNYWYFAAVAPNERFMAISAIDNNKGDGPSPTNDLYQKKISCVILTLLR
jgi:hypothetical protein